jgi:hypothetical protein
MCMTPAQLHLNEILLERYPKLKMIRNFNYVVDCHE